MVCPGRPETTSSTHRAFARTHSARALARQFASLGKMVDEAIPRFRGHPIIEEILTRLERMRQHALE